MRKIIDLSLVIIAFTCSFGCASVPVIDKPSLKEKSPLRVAVYVEDSYYNRTHRIRIGDWKDKKKGHHKYNIYVNAKKLTEEKFSGGFGQIFENVSVTQSKCQDCDLTFAIKILNAEINGTVKRGRGPVDSTVRYRVNVLDNKNNLLDSFYGSGSYRGRGKIKKADVVRGLFALGTLSISTLVTEAWAIESDFEGSFSAAGTIAFNEIFSAIQSSQAIRKIGQRSLEKQTLPANLIATLQYSDKASLIPNNSIDAGEESAINVTLTNKGKGTAFNAKLNTECDFPCVDFDKVIDIGDIPPGESKKLNVKLYGRLELKDGTAPFLMQCTEKRGFDSEKIKLTIPTAHLEKPKIVIASYKINDGKTGLASGNGNGIPENGKTIELTAFVKNNGVGRAINVDLGIASINSGVEVTRKQTEIAQILPGQTMGGKLAFAIPRTYSGGDIRVDLKASDVRGASDGVKQLALNVNTIRPVLAYSYNITDRNGNGFVENGEACELEIRVTNKGQMAASGISIRVDSADLSFSRNRAELDRLETGSANMPTRFSWVQTILFQNAALKKQL